jgi:hypothetical protein
MSYHTAQFVEICQCLTLKYLKLEPAELRQEMTMRQSQELALHLVRRFLKSTSGTQTVSAEKPIIGKVN